jgi:hypothetical protein
MGIEGHFTTIGAVEEFAARRRYTRFGVAQLARFLKMAEQADQNDQWNRHTEQQQDNRSHLDISLPAMAGF